MGHTRKWLLAATAALLVASAVTLAAMRSGILATDARVLAALVGTLLVLLAIEGWLSARALLRRPGLAAAGRLAVVVGLLATGAGGFANWLLSLQGFLILTEGDIVPLFGGKHMQVLEAGPLANVGEMDAVVELGPVKLNPRPGGGFSPEVRLVVGRDGQAGKLLELRHDRAAESGSLRFHQGAYGYSPRLVVTKGERKIFDEDVPFRTRPGGAGSDPTFDGQARLEAEDLLLAGAVSLDPLDEQLRGHPLLVLVVTKGGKPIGDGQLRMGHFADVEGGYRVTFAGMKKWVEVDISRRNYPAPVIGGAGLALAGALAWAAGALGDWWRRRRRGQ